jgi:hypothetical protein
MKKLSFIGVIVGLSAVVPLPLAMLASVGLEVPQKELALTALVLGIGGMALYKLGGGDS